MSHSAKILTLDIETAPIKAKVWGLWDQNVGLNQIDTDWFILSFAAKWLGRDEVMYDDLRGDIHREDDSKLLTQMWQLLDEADIIVGQNIVKFDRKKMNARFIIAGLPPPSPYKMVDTMLVAKRTFGFTSNKLEYLTRHAGLSVIPKRLHAKYPGMELWNGVSRDEPAAWDEMRLYNIDDVRSNEQVYLTMLPWIADHPNVTVYDDSTERRCPKCGSDKLRPRGFYHTNTGKFQRFCCMNCKGWTSDRKSVLSKEKCQSLTK